MIPSNNEQLYQQCSMYVSEQWKLVQNPSIYLATSKYYTIHQLWVELLHLLVNKYGLAIH